MARGKLWGYRDPERRLNKRKKDELDLIRLAEAHPELKSLYPKELLEQMGGISDLPTSRFPKQMFGF